MPNEDTQQFLCLTKGGTSQLSERRLLIRQTAYCTIFMFVPCSSNINPLNLELNPICYLLALLGAHHFLHVSRIRVKSLTLRLLMSYIYIYIYIRSAYS